VQEQVKKAMKMDGKRVGALDMKLERCRPSKGVWAFEETEERNKIFVSNLWADIDQSMLRSKFAKVRYLSMKKTSGIFLLTFSFPTI
jgi:hypothetical protein